MSLLTIQPYLHMREALNGVSSLRFGVYSVWCDIVQEMKSFKRTDSLASSVSHRLSLCVKLFAPGLFLALDFLLEVLDVAF